MNKYNPKALQMRVTESKSIIKKYL